MGGLNPSIFIVCLFTLKRCGAECTVNNTLTWIAIPEADYDRSYSPITEISARPLGFSNGVYVYDTKLSICVLVENVTTSRVQTLISTDPPFRLCVRNDQQPLCTEADGSLTECDTVMTGDEGSALFEFYCDSSCTESDVRFWYRFTVSPDKSGDNEEWCRNQPANFPTSLISVPPNRLLTTTTPSNPNTASSHLVSVVHIASIIMSMLVVLV